MKTLSLCRFISVILLVWTPFFSQAQQQEKTEWKGTIEFENGVKVIKNPSEPLYGEMTFELEEDLNIGNPNDENYAFYKSARIAVDSDGNIFLLDREQNRIQKFNKEGEYQQTIGRRGQGPGEFTSPSDFILDEDNNIYVNESRKLHVFNKTGEFIKSIPLNSFYRSIGITKEGNILAQTQSSTPTELSDDVCLLNSNGEKIKTIAVYVKPRPDYSKGWGFSYTTVQYQLYFCPMNADFSVYGHSSELRLYVLDSSGEIIRIVEKDEPQVPITRKEKDTLIDYQLKSLKMRGFSVSRSEVEKVFNFPTYRPIFHHLLKDDRNNIYVLKLRSFRVDPKDKFIHFDVFNNQGYYLYAVKMTHLPEIIQSGFMYNTRFDEDGYIFIKRYKIKNWDQVKKEI